MKKGKDRGFLQMKEFENKVIENGRKSEIYELKYEVN